VLELLGAVSFPLASSLAQPGANGPQLAVGSRRKAGLKTIPVSFETHSLGTCPQGWRLFLRYFLWHNTRLKAVEWLPVPSLRTIAHTLGNAVTFLRLVRNPATHTFFSSQGTTDLFFLWQQKVERLPARVKTWRETFLLSA
jgi:hypothetical protein